MKISLLFADLQKAAFHVRLKQPIFWRPAVQCTLSNKKHIYLTPYLCNEWIFDCLKFIWTKKFEQKTYKICSHCSFIWYLLHHNRCIIRVASGLWRLMQKRCFDVFEAKSMLNKNFFASSKTHCDRFERKRYQMKRYLLGYKCY